VSGGRTAGQRQIGAFPPGRAEADGSDDPFAGTHVSYPREVTVAPRRLATPSSVNAAIKQIADVMRRANYAGALQYVR
jgi:hypothetical protein